MLPGPAAGLGGLARVGAAWTVRGSGAAAPNALRSALLGDARRAAALGEGCGVRRLQSALYC